jgi:Spermidine synthase
LSIFGKIGEFLGGRKVFSIDRAGHSIRIIQRGNEMILLYNNTIFSRIIKGATMSGGYWDYFTALPGMYLSPKVLLIGLGGGTVVYQLRKMYGHSLPIDVMEIDEDMLKAAEVFLGGKVEANVMIGDGAVLLSDARKAYDIIISDPYINDEMPDQFLSHGFVESLSAALSDDGIAAINYTVGTKGIKNLDQYTAMLKKEFKTYMLDTQTMGNKILLLSKLMDRAEIASKISQSSAAAGISDTVRKGFISMREI